MNKYKDIEFKMREQYQKDKKKDKECLLSRYIYQSSEYGLRIYSQNDCITATIIEKVVGAYRLNFVSVGYDEEEKKVYALFI